MKKTWFERAIFFSWYCKIRSCTYCYMSTQPKDVESKKAVRSKESLVAEAIICRKLGWKLGFFSGGIDAFSNEKFKDILRAISKAYGEKAWLNIGPLNEEQIKDFLPFTEGVVASIETINPEIHKKVCPDKPIGPYLKMFDIAEKYNLKKAITIIVGLGETIEDFDKLKEFIEKYKISKIHFYGLNPQKGTEFENSKPPTVEYQAEWIKKTKESFPDIDIQCGIWEDRPNYIKILLEAGADSISKYPALKSFGSKSAKQIEEQAALAGREFEGSLTVMPNIDWDAEVDNLDLDIFDQELKEKIKKKLNQYVKQMLKQKA